MPDPVCAVSVGEVSAPFNSDSPLSLYEPPPPGGQSLEQIHFVGGELLSRSIFVELHSIFNRMPTVRPMKLTRRTDMDRQAADGTWGANAVNAWSLAPRGSFICMMVVEPDGT